MHLIEKILEFLLGLGLLGWVSQAGKKGDKRAHHAPRSRRPR